MGVTPPRDYYFRCRELWYKDDPEQLEYCDTKIKDGWSFKWGWLPVPVCRCPQCGVINGKSMAVFYFQKPAPPPAPPEKYRTSEGPVSAAERLLRS